MKMFLYRIWTIIKYFKLSLLFSLLSISLWTYLGMFFAAGCMTGVAICSFLQAYSQQKEHEKEMELLFTFQMQMRHLKEVVENFVDMQKGKDTNVH